MDVGAGETLNVIGYLQSQSAADLEAVVPPLRTPSRPCVVLMYNTGRNRADFGGKSCPEGESSLRAVEVGQITRTDYAQ